MVLVREALAEHQQRNFTAHQWRILQDLLASQQGDICRKESHHHLIARDLRMTEEDRASYSSLCRAEDLLDPAVRPELLCYFSTRSNPNYIQGVSVKCCL